MAADCARALAAGVLPGLPGSWLCSMPLSCAPSSACRAACAWPAVVRAVCTCKSPTPYIEVQRQPWLLCAQVRHTLTGQVTVLASSAMAADCARALAAGVVPGLPGSRLCSRPLSCAASSACRAACAWHTVVCALNPDAPSMCQAAATMCSKGLAVHSSPSSQTLSASYLGGSGTYPDQAGYGAPRCMSALAAGACLDCSLHNALQQAPQF